MRHGLVRVEGRTFPVTLMGRWIERSEGRDDAELERETRQAAVQRRRATWGSGAADAGFFMRPTPVEQVREVAASGESMPPKSTYFYPKVPTGLVFNPLT